MRFTPLGLFLLCLTSVPASFASEGVYEINQACVASGCFPGDGPGFPVSIPYPGQFMLTSAVEVDAPVPSVAIQVTSSHVNLDLNGFTIRGETACTATGAIPNQVSCTAAGTGTFGVLVLPAPPEVGAPYRGIAIRNGMIAGMVSGGISAIAARDVTVEDLHVRDIAGFGVTLPLGSEIRRSTVLLTRFDGIYSAGESRIESVVVQASGSEGITGGAGSTITHALSFDNTSHGIFVSNDSQIHDSVARRNGGSGLLAGFGSQISRTTASSNTQHGLRFVLEGAVSDSVFISNGDDGINCVGVCSVNGNTIRQNAGDGLEIRGGGTVLRNVVNANAGFGLNAGGGNPLFDENNLNGNGAGGAAYTDGGGVSGGSNLCGGASC